MTPVRVSARFLHRNQLPGEKWGREVGRCSDMDDACRIGGRRRLRQGLVRVKGVRQKRPLTFPSSVMSTFMKAGMVGRPGMVRISPQRG